MPPPGFVVAHRQSHRRGSALLVVLVVVMLLTLSAYTYTQTMQTEFEAAVMHGQDIQARQAADSGVEYAAMLLARRTSSSDVGLSQNPPLFQAIPVVETERPGLRARFTILTPAAGGVAGGQVRYGLADESARLNLNLLNDLQKDLQLEDEDISDWLLSIPGMTQETGDAIRDWIDEDQDKRPYGAESEAYQSRSPPYSAKNGPLESLDELLLVQGVTAGLLYGEDANRNGLLDLNENDGEASPPLDNADGVLNVGWTAYLTVNSRERNLRADGQPRINLNSGLLTDLYDQLEEAFDEDTAKFVIAYRMNGPTEVPADENADPNDVKNKKLKNNNSSNNGGSKGNSSGSSKKQQQQQTNDNLQKLTQDLAKTMFQKGGQVTRGDMDLSKGGSTQIKSIYDLIGSQTTATADGATTTLDSPWGADAGTLSSLLPKLVDTLSTTDDAYLQGRININEARPELLAGIPGMTAEVIQSVQAAQSRQAQGVPSADVILKHSTTGWLLTDGLVDIAMMRELDPYLTARGDVYRAQVLGFFEAGGPVHRQEAMIDATRNPPRILWQRDLNELGRGYLKSHLMPVATP